MAPPLALSTNFRITEGSASFFSSGGINLPRICFTEAVPLPRAKNIASESLKFSPLARSETTCSGGILRWCFFSSLSRISFPRVTLSSYLFCLNQCLILLRALVVLTIFSQS